MKTKSNSGALAKGTHGSDVMGRFLWPEGSLFQALCFLQKRGVIIMEKSSMEKSSARIQATLALYENERLKEVVRNLKSVGLDSMKILNDAMRAYRSDYLEF